MKESTDGTCGFNGWALDQQPPPLPGSPAPAQMSCVSSDGGWAGELCMKKPSWGRSGMLEGETQQATENAIGSPNMADLFPLHF